MHGTIAGIDSTAVAVLPTPKSLADVLENVGVAEKPKANEIVGPATGKCWWQRADQLDIRPAVWSLEHKPEEWHLCRMPGPRGEPLVLVHVPSRHYFYVGTKAPSGLLRTNSGGALRAREELGWLTAEDRNTLLLHASYPESYPIETRRVAGTGPSCSCVSIARVTSGANSGLSQFGFWQDIVFMSRVRPMLDARKNEARFAKRAAAVAAVEARRAELAKTNAQFRGHFIQSAAS